MKSFKFTIALFIALSQFISITISSTPKANDLANHFGTEPVKDVYGPKVDTGFNLRREGVKVGEPFTPIYNYHQEINNKEVVAGDLTNAAYDASKIITPNLAKPKAVITTTFNHEAVINTPVHVGTDVQRKTVTSFNRLTGKVDSQTIETRKPVLALLKTARNVKSDHVTTVDMTNGKILKGGEPKVLHGK